MHYGRYTYLRRAVAFSGFGWLPVEVEASTVAEGAVQDCSTALRSKPRIVEVLPLSLFKARRDFDCILRKHPHELQAEFHV